MPEMDGYEASALIRQNEVKEIASIPILAMTANAMRGDEEKCLLAGMNGYISKPISAEKLESIVLAWLTNDIARKSEFQN